jgi:2-polyprenyl-3-methyl-5-hydroxy-6-metoxy-1,4-benzoquinol methylase
MIKDLFKKYLINRKVLDIGSTGHRIDSLCESLIDLRKYNKHVIGSDINKELIAKSERTYLLDITNRKNTNKFLTEFGKFDTITCLDVIEHIANHGLMLENIYTLLNDKGIVIISTPNVMSPEWIEQKKQLGYVRINTDHVCWFDELTLETLLKRYNFTIVDMVIEGLPLKYYPQPKYDSWELKKLLMIGQKNEV